MHCVAGPGDKAPVDYVLVAVTDQHDKLLSPQAPISKLCNPPTCHQCVKTWLLDNAHIAPLGFSRGHMGQGLVQGCATAGRRVQSYLVYVGAPVLGFPLHRHRLRGTAVTAACEVQRTMRGSRYGGAIQ